MCELGCMHIHRHKNNIVLSALVHTQYANTYSWGHFKPTFKDFEMHCRGVIEKKRDKGKREKKRLDF